ncbi:MAG: hypothetical protein ALAOOOJD_04475 [bacterium]|nr:hypothetical protein [bacterium]
MRIGYANINRRMKGRNQPDATADAGGNINQREAAQLRCGEAWIGREGVVSCSAIGVAAPRLHQLCVQEQAFAPNILQFELGRAQWRFKIHRRDRSTDTVDIHVGLFDFLPPI